MDEHLAGARLGRGRLDEREVRLLRLTHRTRRERHPPVHRNRHVPAFLELLQDPPADDHAVHLVGAVVDAGAAGVHVHRASGVSVGEPERAVHLHRAVDHLVQHARGVELDQRDLDARLVALVDLVRGVEGHQPAGLDLGGGVGDPVLDRLLVGEGRAEGLALERVRLHMSSNARCIWPSQRMTWWMRPGPSRFCAIRKPSPRLAEHVRGRHAHARVAHLAVRRPAPPRVAEDRDRAVDLEARRVGRDDDLARAPVRLRVGIGDRHHDPEPRALGARREPLVAVDHPLVAVEHGARLQPVGSEPETSGSVIEKNDRVSPSTSGRRKRSFCSSVPNRWRISPLPASGAWQLKTSWAQTLRPISSFRCA